MKTIYVKISKGDKNYNKNKSLVVKKRPCMDFIKKLILLLTNWKNKYTISKDSDANKIIGINIYKTKDGYKINQEDYINKIIKNYNINKTKIINYPYRKISKNERINEKTCWCW